MKKVQDHYFKQAKKDFYVARSVYKLKEINEAHRIINPGTNILDLGSSPGSWLQYILQISSGKSKITGIDLKPLKISPSKNLNFILGDIFEVFSDDNLSAYGRFDCILSDMAPGTTGIRNVDTIASLELAQKTADIAKHLLKTNGTLLFKIFQGKGHEELHHALKNQYRRVKIIKPEGSRSESREIYFLCKSKKKCE